MCYRNGSCDIEKLVGTTPKLTTCLTQTSIRPSFLGVFASLETTLHDLQGYCFQVPWCYRDGSDDIEELVEEEDTEADDSFDSDLAEDWRLLFLDLVLGLAPRDL